MRQIFRRKSAQDCLGWENKMSQRVQAKSVRTDKGATSGFVRQCETANTGSQLCPWHTNVGYESKRN